MGELLPLSPAVAISPAPIMAVILILPPAVPSATLVLGLLLLALAVKQWRSPGEPGTPGWTKAIDTVTPAEAAALATVNPKNLMMCVVVAQGGEHQILLLVIGVVLIGKGLA